MTADGRVSHSSHTVYCLLMLAGCNSNYDIEFQYLISLFFVSKRTADGGPDGADAMSLEGGALFSFYNTEVRMQGNNRVKIVAFLRPMHSMNAQQKKNL
eukprot:scaffold1452_cov117-Isochrysis_galbana.AAC.8